MNSLIQKVCGFLLLVTKLIWHCGSFRLRYIQDVCVSRDDLFSPCLAYLKDGFREKGVWGLHSFVCRSHAELVCYLGCLQNGESKKYGGHSIGYVRGLLQLRNHFLCEVQSTTNKRKFFQLDSKIWLRTVLGRVREFLVSAIPIRAFAFWAYSGCLRFSGNPCVLASEACPVG